MRQVKREGFLRVGNCKVCGASAEWILWRNVLIDFKDLSVELVFYCDVHKPIVVS